MRRARQAQASGSARTFVAAEAQRVGGFFRLTVGQVETLEAPERIRKGMGAYPVPVVILARLCVLVQDQGLGNGVGLLKVAIRHALMICDQAGIRALLHTRWTKRTRGFRTVLPLRLRHTLIAAMFGSNIS